MFVLQASVSLRWLAQHGVCHARGRRMARDAVHLWKSHDPVTSALALTGRDAPRLTDEDPRLTVAVTTDTAMPPFYITH